MAAKTFVEHLLGCDDKIHTKENILSFLSSRKVENCITSDYLESLNTIVSHLLGYLTNSEPDKLAQDQWTVDVLNTILNETCIPTLQIPRPTAFDKNKREKMKIFELTCNLVSKIVCQGPMENAQCVWMLTLKSLKNFVDECKSGLDVGHEVDGDGQALEVATALDLLANLLDTVNNWNDERLKFVQNNLVKGIEDTVLYNVLNVLSVVQDGSVLFKITGRILPQLLSINEITFFQNTKIIWDAVKILRLQEQDDNSGFFTSYAIISSLADLYFNERRKSAFQIHQDPDLWFMIQTGMVNIDSLVRKRSLYVLQRVVQMFNNEHDWVENVYLEDSSPVFWWRLDNAEPILEIWHQFVFFMEILEEKQLHVIQPVLPRIVELINATRKTKEFSSPLLHVSWLSVIIHRAAIHENRFIKKWGITSLLTLDLEQVPLLDNVVTRNFTCDTLIMLLKEPTLYAKNHGEDKNEASLLAKQLLGFFKKCFDALREEDKKEFFMQVFTSISRYNISHVPLTFISQSLSHVPRFAAFGSEMLIILRDIISNMISHSVVLRGTVKSFLLRTFMNLVNPERVTVHELFVFLGSFGKEDSLCRVTPLWNEATAWLAINLDLFQKETNDMFTTLDNYVGSFLKSENGDRTRDRAVRLAKFLLLLHDCSAITKNQMRQLLDAIFVTIGKAQSNVYHPVSSSWQGVELLHGLFHELLPAGKNPSNADDIIITLMACVHDVLDDLTQTLIRVVGEEDEYCSFHGYNAYFALLDKVNSLWLSQKFSENEHLKYQTLLNKLIDLGLSLWDAEQETQRTTVKHWLHFLVTLKLISWAVEFTDATDFDLSNERRRKFFKNVWSCTLTSNLRFLNDENCRKGLFLKEDSWRNIAQDVITAKWRCIILAIKESHTKEISYSSSGTLATSSYQEIVEACIEALSVTSGAACYPCLETLRLCLPKLIEDGDKETTILLLKTAWSVLNEIRTRYSAYFWPAFDIVVKIVFAPELLGLSGEAFLISEVKKHWKSLLSIADDQSGLVSVSVAHLCKVFSDFYQSQSVDLTSVELHADIIADICLFGPVHKKDLKLLFDTAAYVKSLGEESGIVSTTKFRECERESARVRVDLVAFLLAVDYNDETHSLFLHKVIEVLLERNQMLSEIKASRFLNSENHRQKQRLWQVILILVSRITNKQFALTFSDHVLRALESDNQTSVRFFMEWSLVRLFSSHINILDAVWEKMEYLRKVRLGYVASLISIVTHVFFTLEEPESQMDYLQRLIPAIIPCAFLNHSQIRAYILAALQLISFACSEDVWSQISQQFPIIQSCLLFTDSVVEGTKEMNRLQKDRDLFSLHPIKDFNIEVIFQTVPLIAGVVDDEVISPGAFRSEGSALWVETSDLPLNGRTSKQESGKEEKATELFTTVTASSVEFLSVSSDTITSDIQKKITPWNVIAPPQQDQDSFDQLRQRPIERRIGDLVVVASLVDRAPNLGGLCRTCEIFGVSRLVLGSKHVVSEKDFKSVSVSSEKWVDVEEVKVHDLEMYLQRMKREGFAIVGVEQTAQSKKLTDFQFPSSTVLVLGNEKAGIPVEIIQVLDECVEIPQHGIIRSLNVHVSGALFIWEYSRQHLNDK